MITSGARVRNSIKFIENIALQWKYSLDEELLNADYSVSEQMQTPSRCLPVNIMNICFRNRKMIYCYLLKNMPEDLRFRLIRKLCLGILQAVADGQISVQDENGANVFTDTLDILRSEVRSPVKETFMDLLGYKMLCKGS